MKLILHNSHKYTPFLYRHQTEGIMVHWNAIDRVEVTEGEWKEMDGLQEYTLAITCLSDGNFRFYGKPIVITPDTGEIS